MFDVSSDYHVFDVSSTVSDVPEVSDVLAHPTMSRVLDDV